MVASLFQLAADKGVLISMTNFAECLKYQIGTSQDLDRAAEYYYKSLKGGYYRTKRLLDQIYSKALKF